MITVIHGEDVVTSRKYLNELKHTHKDIHVLEGQTLTKEVLVQIIEGGSLFTNSITLAIEDFFTKRKAIAKDTKEIISYLAINGQNADILIWEGKELPKAIFSHLPGVTNNIFKLPSDVFEFLDNVLIVQPKNKITLLHKVLATSEEQFIFFMLIKQIRMLLALSEQGFNNIGEVNGLSPWQKNKLYKLLQHIPRQKLIKIYKNLYDIDFAQKTGKLPISLTQSLDFLFLEF